MQRKRNRVVLLSILALLVSFGLWADDNGYFSARGNYTFLSSTIDGADSAISFSGSYLGKNYSLGFSFYSSGDDRAISVKDRFIVPKKESTRTVFKDGFLREERCGLFHTSLKLLQYGQGNIAKHTEAEFMVGIRLEKDRFENVSFIFDASVGIYSFETRMRNFKTGKLLHINLAYDLTLGVNVRNRLFMNVSATSETDFYIPYNTSWAFRSELLYRINDSWSLGYEDNMAFNDLYFNAVYVTRHERSIFFVWRCKV